MHVDPVNPIGDVDAPFWSHAVFKHGRVYAGALAAAGSFAILAHGGAAEAKTLPPSSTTHTQASTASKPAAPAATNYAVKKGDTLSDIARRSGVTLDALVKANQVNPKKYIQIGQPLVIPPRASSSSGAKGSGHGVLPTDLPKNSPRWQLKPTFQRAAKQYGVPVGMLESMAWNESGWQNNVVSSTGAVGIGQLMPNTVAFINSNLVSKPLDPTTNEGNIKMSASFLGYLINQNKGDYKNALAAYYQGQKSLNQRGMYDDTKQYVATVAALDNRYF